MSEISIGIIGCGAATVRYYAPIFKTNKDVVDHLYLVDKSTESASELKSVIGYGDITTDYQNVLDKVQGAIIALPNALHFPVSMDLLNAGIHVLCEKPLAQKSSEIDKLAAAAASNQVRICVNNTRRMYPAFKKIKEIILENKIGTIQSIRYVEGNTFEWQSKTGFYVNPKVTDKGLISDLGPHVLDLICWWTGAKPEILSYEDDSGGGPESVVKIKAQLNQCHIDILLNRLNALESHFCIQGSSGKISGQTDGWKSFQLSSNEGDVRKFKLKTRFNTYPEFVRPIVENFFEVIQHNRAPLVSGEDVKPSIQMIEECYEKRKLNTPPAFSLPYTVSQKSLKTLVTGATGFIGGRVVEIFQKSKARNVVAGVRQWSSAARLGRNPVDVVMLDLMDTDSIYNALEGIDEIVHCAKGASDVNVQGTKNLLDAAFIAKIKRFVHLSTAEVYGNVNGNVTEDFPFRYTKSDYNQSKIDAEEACWKYSDQGLPLTVLRPSIVYGPFNMNWTVRIARMLIGRTLGIYEKIGEGKCNLIYVDDLVKSILYSLDNDQSIGNAFNIVGAEVPTWNEYFERFNQSMNLPSLKSINISQTYTRSAFTEPLRFVGNVVRDHFMTPTKKIAETFDFAKSLMKSAEKKLKTSLSNEDLILFQKSVVYSSQKSKELLNFEPDVSLDDGLKRTAIWLADQGVLQGTLQNSKN